MGNKKTIKTKRPNLNKKLRKMWEAEEGYLDWKYIKDLIDKKYQLGRNIGFVKGEMTERERILKIIDNFEKNPNKITEESWAKLKEDIKQSKE